MRIVYALLCIIGTLLPLMHFTPWLTTNGLAVQLLVHEAFGSPIAAFAWSDVLISALALLAFIAVESRRLGMRRAWVPVVGLCLVGVSLALPLFLLMRESRIIGMAGHRDP